MKTGVAASREELAAAPFTLQAEAYGVCFRVQVPSSLPHAMLLNLLPHGSSLLESVPAEAVSFAVQPGPSETHVTRAGDELTGEWPTLSEALEQLTRDLMIHVADHAPDRVFVHAGVVAIAGHGLVLPGTSFAGKTTLTAALVRAGATYFSDEYAVLDAEGRAHPYARALQMRQPGGTAQQGVPVEALNGVAGAEPLRITHVLFARYKSGARWQPQRMTSGMAVLEMLRHAIAIQRSPVRVMAALSAMMAGARAWESERDDADLLVPALLAAVREQRELR